MGCLGDPLTAASERRNHFYGINAPRPTVAILPAAPCHPSPKYQLASDGHCKAGLNFSGSGARKSCQTRLAAASATHERYCQNLGLSTGRGSRKIDGPAYAILPRIITKREGGPNCHAAASPVWPHTPYSIQTGPTTQFPSMLVSRLSGPD